MKLLKHLLGVAESGSAEPCAPVEPLSEAELKRMGKWLASRKLHGDHVEDIHALDGFVTCVAVSPKAVTHGEWLAWLFNLQMAPDDERPYIDMMVRRLREVTHSCAQRPATYRPLLETHGHLRGVRAPLRAWSHGFVLATVPQDAKWDKRLRDPESARWMYPIWDASGEEGPCELDLPMLKGAVLAFNTCRRTA